MRLYYKSKKNGFDAQAEIINGKITVLKGSTLNKNLSYKIKIAKQVQEIRSNKEYVDDNRVLVKDVTLSSLSTAGQLVSGTSVNGNKVWKDINGICYGEIKNK